jgi:outer membrane murein-binding lipoprotein Lpp
VSSYEWAILLTSLLSILLIPALVLLVRISQKWTRSEDKLEQIASDMSDLVIDKDKVHQELVNQMREDRNATNLRLRYLEENFWRRR